MTSCSGAMLPETSVPVTTAPNPFMVKARSMGKRKSPRAFFSDYASGRCLRARRAVRAQALRRSWRSPERSARLPETNPPRIPRSPCAPVPQCPDPPDRLSSARSIPSRIPSSRQISKCSRVCGLIDSPAAITSMHDIDTAGAGQHVLDETLVPGHVDEARCESRASMRDAQSRGRW